MLLAPIVQPIGFDLVDGQGPDLESLGDVETEPIVRPFDGPSFTDGNVLVPRSTGEFYYETRDAITTFTSSGLTVMFKDEHDRIGHTPDGYRIQFDGANERTPVGAMPRGDVAHYLLGDKPDEWVLGVGHYGELVYENIWDGVDLRFFIQDDALKYECHVRPGGDPRSIRFVYIGVDDLHIEVGSGDLRYSYKDIELRESAPLAFQRVTTGARTIECTYLLLSRTMVGFKIADYDKGTELVIDPIMNSFTFVGGSEWDRAAGVVVGEDGCIYMAGSTRSADYPSKGGLANNSYNAYDDVVVLKFDPTGTNLLFSTYIGGEYSDISFDIALDHAGNIVICGETASEDFPTTPGAYSTVLQGYDAFILKLDPNGTELLFSTYIGGSQAATERATALAIAPNDDILVAGITYCSDFPTTPGAYDETYNGQADIFVTRLAANGSDVLSSTYLGGAGRDQVKGCAIASNGNLTIVGETESTGYPTTEGAFCRTHNGGLDGIVTGLDDDLLDLRYSTFVGGGQDDSITGIVVDGTGRICVVGVTSSTAYPCSADALGASLRGTSDLVLTILGPGCTALDYSTYIGGSRGEAKPDIAVDEAGLVYIAGTTDSGDLPMVTPSIDASYNGGNDVIVLKVDSISSRILNSTYIGGSSDEENPRIALDNELDVVVVGETKSVDFPTTIRSFDTSYNGGSRDSFVCRFHLGAPQGGLPTGPNNANATSLERSIMVSWERPDEDGDLPLFGYRLLRGASAGTLTTHEILDQNTFNFTDIGLQAGTEYFYSVVAFNTLGDGGMSMVVSAIPWGQPSAPGDLESSPGCATVVLLWSVPEDTGDLPLSGYRILRGDAGLDLSPIAELGPLVDQYRDEGLVNGRTYFYSVVGFNARGDGVPSTIVSVMPIGPPEQVMGFDGMAGDGTATLQWQAPSSDGGRPIIGYVLYRGSSNDDLAPLVVLGISFSYTDMELVNNQTVYYSITAYNELGNGSRVPPLPVHPVGPPTVPTLFAATPDDRRVTLIWDRPINDGGYPVTGYRIYRGPYVGALSNLATTGPVHSYTDTNVMNGETYLYQVRAVNVLGEGPPTSVLTSMPMGPPGAPVDLTMQALDRAFFLRWSAPLDWGGSQSLSYRVFRGDSIDTAQPLVELTGVQEYIDDDIIPGGMYVYLVRAVSVAGMGPRSNGVQAIAGTLPGEPRNITADAQNGYIALHWGPPDVGIWYPITQYVVFRGLFTSGLAEIARLTNTQSFNDTSVITGQTYHYAVAASNLIGTGPLSVIVSVKAGRSPFPPTGLELSVEDGRVMLKWYPPTMEMPGVDSYVVLRGEQRDLLVEIAIVTGQTSFTDDTTVRGKRYFYSIMARNEYGQSDNSTVESVEVPEIENKLLLTSMIIIGAAGVVMILMLGRLRTRLRRSVDRAQPEARRPGPER